MIQERNVRRFCYEPEHIENYALAMSDESQVWHCHHRLEVQGKFRNSVKLLKRCGMYYHRPASELVFLTHSEHARLHQIGNKYRCGKHHSDETKRRIREAKVGIHLTMEHRRKISEKSKGRILSSETRRKMSEYNIQKKKVEMTRLSDGYTREFPSMGEATRWLRLNGHPKATTIHVSECANGHRKTAYNATWRNA